MNDELERFFKSIGFTPTSDIFSSASVEKVVLNKKLESFEVFINVSQVLDINEANQLLLCAENGINGEKKCKINLQYQEILEDDILRYIYYILDEI